MIRMLRGDELEDSGVYEFTYAENGDREKYWSDSSFYLNWGDDEENSIVSLTPYILRAIPEFNWYGPNRIELTKWNEIRALASSDPERDPTLDEFFVNVDKWLRAGNGGEDHFWIFGP